MFDRVNPHLVRIESEIAGIRALYQNEPEPIPEGHIVRAGENLQGALDSHDIVTLEAGATFENSYIIRRPNSKLFVNGNHLIGQDGPALTIPAYLYNIEIRDLNALTNHNNTVVLCGYNDSKQTSLDSVPYDILFYNCNIPSHRGKRGFEINSRATTLRNCNVFDLWDEGVRDNQAIAILNSPGDILIEGGHYQAASENILVGGDRMKIPNTRPTNIGIHNLQVTKPLEWKGQIPVKNLIELKDGHSVTIRNVYGRNCWKSGQDGYAFVFTPTLGASLQNIQVIDCDIENVSSIVQVLGVDINGENDVRSQVLFQGGRYRTNRLDMEGRGIFALATGGPDYLDIENVDSVHDGSQFVYLGDTRPVNRLKIIDSKWNTGQYGITIGGAHQANNSAGLVSDFFVERNEITINGMNSTQSRLFRERIPNNTFL